MNQIEYMLRVKHKLGCSGSIGLSAVSLGSTFLFSSSCLHCVTHLWPSACSPMHVWMYVRCEAVGFFFFFFHIFHVGLSHIMSALPLTLLLCLIHRGTHTRNTQSGQGLWTEPTGRLVSRLLCCLSWAVLVMSAFEVDADSWMEELRAPMVEEKAQGNISEPRLDMAMRVYTLTHTYTVSTGSLHCRDSKKKKEKKKKTPTTKKLNPTE